MAEGSIGVAVVLPGEVTVPNVALAPDKPMATLVPAGVFNCRDGTSSPPPQDQSPATRLVTNVRRKTAGIASRPSILLSCPPVIALRLATAAHSSPLLERGHYGLRSCTNAM